MLAPAIELHPRDGDAVTTRAPDLRAPDLSAHDLPAFRPGNVVAFVGPRRQTSETLEAPLDVAPGERWCTPVAPAGSRAALRAGLVLASVLLHIGVIAFLARAPQPLVGVEQSVMTVDIVLGEPTPSTPDAAADRMIPREPVAQRAPEHDDRKAVPPEATAPPPTEPDEAPSPASEPPQPNESALPQSSPPAEQSLPQNEEIVSDRAERPAAEPAPPVAPPPRIEPPPVARPRSHSPVHAKPPATRNAHADAPKHEGRMAPPAAATNASGRGAPRADPAYYGRVAAHLARYKQFPPEARNSHSQGAAAVTFTIDAAGRVTSVRLVRGTGVESLDREAQAMTRRASPFPPPPTGHPMTFTVPVNFVMR